MTMIRLYVHMSISSRTYAVVHRSDNPYRMPLDANEFETSLFNLQTFFLPRLTYEDCWHSNFGQIIRGSWSDSMITHAEMISIVECIRTKTLLWRTSFEWETLQRAILTLSWYPLLFPFSSSGRFMRLLGEDGVELRAESTRTTTYISEKVNERYTIELMENIFSFSVLLFLQLRLSLRKLTPQQPLLLRIPYLPGY